MALTFAALRAINVARCTSADGFNHPLDGWSTADWLIAVAGEHGEALNVVKKLNRLRDGIAAGDPARDALVAALADELADTVIYIDLLLAACGVTVPPARDPNAGFETLNTLLRTALAKISSAPAASIIGMGDLARAADGGDEDWLRQASLTLLVELNGVAVSYGIDLGAAVVRKFNATSAKHGMPHNLMAEVSDKLLADQPVAGRS